MEPHAHKLTDAEHKILDDRVNEVTLIQEFRNMYKSFSVPPYLPKLLQTIVQHSPTLNQHYADSLEAAKILNNTQDLQSKLLQAWKQGEYRTIRDVALLQASGATPKPEPKKSQAGTLTGKLRESFERPYRGTAVDAFYEYLTEINRPTSSESGKPYGKFCSIVQSSGMGKSRLMIELCQKDVLVIYMNLRARNDNGFPSRDNFPARVLTEDLDLSSDDYAARCSAFWIAIFHTLRVRLEGTPNQSEEEKIKAIQSWNEKMCKMESSDRHEFFQKVEAQYQVEHLTIVQGMKDEPRVQETMNQLSHLSVDDSSKKDSLPAPYVPGDHKLRSAFSELLKVLRKLSTAGVQKGAPQVVIAIDEAHTLRIPQPSGFKRVWQPADIFCRAISTYSVEQFDDHSFWVVFASTTSRVADFAPPQQHHNSLRVTMGGKLLYAPYTALGWDQYARALGDISAVDVAQFEHIMSFGRPLWASLKDVEVTPYGIIKTAAAKLTGTSDKFDGNNPHQALAVLGQRFGLHVSFGHPESVTYLDSAVASHLRVCVGITQDRTWKYTRYPSEPLLSCAAAELMHNPVLLKGWLGVLQNKINSGMVDKGQRGELASRILLLLAKDFFVCKDGFNRFQKSNDEDPWKVELTDCCMVPVVDFLTFIFGERVWEDENNQALKTAREEFANAFINFSHWVSMDSNIDDNEGKGQLGMGPWTLRHWHRTAAVQCCHGQPRIDKVIPIYFKNPNPSGVDNVSYDVNNVSYIFVSDKATIETNADVLRSISCTTLSVQHNGNPYIAILLDMGAKTASFSATFATKQVARKNKDIEGLCLRIHAIGMDPETYPFLRNRHDILHFLRDLVQPHPHARESTLKTLDAQPMYGSSQSKIHMEWEGSGRVREVGTSAQP